MRRFTCDHEVSTLRISATEGFNDVGGFQESCTDVDDRDNNVLNEKVLLRSDWIFIIVRLGLDTPDSTTNQEGTCDCEERGEASIIDDSCRKGMKTFEDCKNEEGHAVLLSSFSLDDCEDHHG